MKLFVKQSTETSAERDVPSEAKAVLTFLTEGDMISTKTYTERDVPSEAKTV
jgi:hypothetical protein